MTTNELLGFLQEIQTASDEGIKCPINAWFSGYYHALGDIAQTLRIKLETSQKTREDSHPKRGFEFL